MVQAVLFPAEPLALPTVEPAMGFLLEQAVQQIAGQVVRFPVVLILLLIARSRRIFPSLGVSLYSI